MAGLCDPKINYTQAHIIASTTNSCYHSVQFRSGTPKDPNIISIIRGGSYVREFWLSLGLAFLIYPSWSGESSPPHPILQQTSPPKTSSSSPSPSPAMAAAAATSFATLVSRGALLRLLFAHHLPTLQSPDGPSRVACRPSRARRGSGPSSPPRPPPRRSSPSAAPASPRRPSPSPGASRRRPPTAGRASQHPPAPSPRYHLYAAGFLLSLL